MVIFLSLIIITVITLYISLVMNHFYIVLYIPFKVFIKLFSYYINVLYKWKIHNRLEVPLPLNFRIMALASVRES